MLCWIDHVWSSKECVCCACDSNERLSAPSICFVCVFVCRKLSPHLGAKADSVSSVNCVCFLVVGKGPPVLLQSVVISYVNCGNYG